MWETEFVSEIISSETDVACPGADAGVGVGVDDSQSGIVREVILRDELERAPFDRVQHLLRLLVYCIDVSCWARRLILIQSALKKISGNL